MLLCPGKGFLQRPIDLIAADQRLRLRPGDHHQVHHRGQPASLAPEPIAHASLDAIANHGIADPAAGADTQAPPTRGSAQGHQHDEFARSGAKAATRNPVEILRIQESVRPLEAAGLVDHDYLDATVVAKRLRPLALRRFRIARPARVFMRSRNPCFLSRLIRLG